MSIIDGLAMGQIGYVPMDALRTYCLGNGPAIAGPIYTDQTEVGGGTLSVYNNPRTHAYEVCVTPGVKAAFDPRSLSATKGYYSVTLILPDSRRITNWVPDGYWK